MTTRTRLCAYLKKHHLSQRAFAAVLELRGWRPDAGTVSRWVSGESPIRGAALALVAIVTEGEVR